MRIYVSGPMSGVPQFNFPRFDEVARYIAKCGWVFVSPAERDREVYGTDKADGFAEGDAKRWAAATGMSIADALAWDTAAILDCDAIAMLPGWEQSIGATYEKTVAEKTGKEVLYAVLEGERCVYLQPEDPAKPQLVGFLGYAQAGKDTAATALVNLGWTRIAFADPLRQMLKALDPYIGKHDSWRLSDVLYQETWDEAKTRLPEVRALLQRLGTEAGREVLGPNVWVDAAMAKVKPYGRYVFSDVRFPNEANAILAAGGKLIRIERPGTLGANTHRSETALDDYDVDLTVNNYGSIEYLHSVVRGMVRQHLAMHLEEA